MVAVTHSTLSQQALDRGAQNLCAAVIGMAVQDAKAGHQDALAFVFQRDRIEPWLWPLVPDGEDVEPYLTGLRRQVPDPRPVAPVEAEAVDIAENTTVTLNDLTRRQREVLSLVADGRTTAAIADELFVSRQTVKNHLHAVYRKIGIPHRESGYFPIVLAARWYWEQTR